MDAPIFRPFAYLWIRHEKSTPHLINWAFPLLASLAGSTLLFLVSRDMDIFGANGLLSRFLSFVQSLPGFYIAALAAIATFNNPDMHKLMPGAAPEMKVQYNQGWEWVKLTRRRFLSAMFGYLTALSLLLTIGSILLLTIAQPLKESADASLHIWMKWGASWVICFFVCQMVFVTMWGLFYLGERLHTPDT